MSKKINKKMVTICLFILYFLCVGNSLAGQYKKHFEQAVTLARAGRALEGERHLSTLINSKQGVSELYIWRARFRLTYLKKYISSIEDFRE